LPILAVPRVLLRKPVQNFLLSSFVVVDISELVKYTQNGDRGRGEMSLKYLDYFLLFHSG
jgi:hypothetical protein